MTDAQVVPSWYLTTRRTTEAVNKLNQTRLYLSSRIIGSMTRQYDPAKQGEEQIDGIQAFWNRAFNFYQFAFDLDASGNIFPKPTLVLLGKFDIEVGFGDALKAIENYPKATFAILAKAGHSLSWEQPELFSALVSDWLKRVEAHVNWINFA